MLLYRHIKREEPQTQVFWIDSWPKDGDWQNRLETEYGWKIDDGSVLIIDEAQLTYEDTGLWNTLFKPFSAYPEQYDNRIILFANYGSPAGAAVGGTTMVIPPRQRITLRPVDHDNGIVPIGLFLTPTEFDEFISKQYPPASYSFDQTFLRWIFHLTLGHVGAIEDLLHVVIATDVCLYLFTPRMI